MKIKFFNFRHKFTIEPKFNKGDICMWPGLIDSCDDAVVKIIDCHYKYDKNTGNESVLYDFVDIDSDIKYSNINEKEIYLLATNEEMMEGVYCIK